MGRLRYEPDTGHVYRVSGRKVGKRAETWTVKGGGLIKIDGIRYAAHRVIWKMVTGEDPPDQIDHRDVDPANNRWDNLRIADYSGNCLNRKWSLRDGKPRGVYRYGKGWIVRFTFQKREYVFYKGYDLEEACRIAREKIKELHGEFFCAGSEA